MSYDSQYSTLWKRVLELEIVYDFVFFMNVVLDASGGFVSLS